MRNLKKFLALVLAMMMLFSLMITVNAESPMDAEYQAAYDALELYGVFRGVTNVGNDKLDGDFTRAQMAAVAYRIATGDTADEQIALYAQYAADTFDDVKVDDWYAGYVGFCANGGIVVGFGDGRFGPNSKVTGMQATAMLLRLLGYDANGEFQGPNWATNVATEGRRLGITTGLTDASLSNYATRGVAAYIAYRGATIPNQVVYAYGDVYLSRYSGTPTGYTGSLTNWSPLIWTYTNNGSARRNVWGDPIRTDTVYVQFRWPVNIVTHTVGSETITPVFEFYDTITECDLADALGFDGNRLAWTYTNGYWNDAVQAYYSYSATTNYNVTTNSALVIQALDTVNKVGQEGRWSRVYRTTAYQTYLDTIAAGGSATFDFATQVAYEIVGVDTFLGVVTNTWGAIMDPNDHTIIPAGASVDVYYNELAVGSTSDKTNLVYNSVSASSYVLSLNVAGDFSVGEKIGVYVATATNGTTVAAGTVKNIMNTTTANASTNDTGAEIEEGYDIEPVTVTVNSITYDSVPGATGSIVGFKDTSGRQYFYNYTFCGPVLDGTAIGQTYNLWLTPNNSDTASSDNSVLYYERTNPGAGFGVVTQAVVTQINSNAYVVDYTILTPDGNEVPVRAGQPGTGLPFGGQTAAEQYANGTGTDPNLSAKFGDLVYYEGTNNYYKLTNTKTGVGAGFGNSLYDDTLTEVASGRAGAIGQTYANTASTNNFVVGTGTYQTLVDDATIFFVAINNLDNTTGGTYNYKFDHYEIYRGFKTLPDLGIANAGNDTIDVVTGAINNLNVQAFDVAGNAIDTFSADKYAKYVVINNATSRTTPPASIPTVDYAFILSNDQLTDMTATYYNFPAFVNGSQTTLQVAISAGRQVLTNGIGLYAYSNNTNGQGYSVVNIMDGTTAAANGGNLGMAAPYCGSFKLTGVTYSNSVIEASDGNRYTVADNCPAYLVNPTHGGISPLSLGAVQLYSYGGGADVWYQLNEYGQICLIYVVDVNLAA